MIYNLFRVEFFKSLRFKMLWFAMLLPAILPVFTIFALINQDAEVFRNNMLRDGERNAYYHLSSMTYFLFSLVMAMIAAMIIISLNYLERQANGWKYLMMSPVTSAQLIAVKIFVGLIFIFASVFLFYSSHMILGFIFSKIRPDLKINPTLNDHIHFLLIYLRITFSSVGILCIFWAISIASKSYIVISIFLSIFGMLIPGKFSPFQLPWETLSHLTQNRRTLNKSHLTVNNLDLLEVTHQDILSIGWFIVGFILIIVFFKPLTKKLI